MIGAERLDHVQVMVPKALEAAAIAFYGETLGLTRIRKPDPSRGGAWFDAGGAQVHLSIEDVDTDALARSRRHLCLVVRDVAEAERALRSAGVEILPDDRPVPGWRRFYVRDPAGNRVEIARSSL